MNGEPWTEAELQIIYDHVNDPDYLFWVRRLLPDRTTAAIQNRMSRLRREAGIGNIHSGPRACDESRLFTQMADEGSKRLAAAIEAELYGAQRVKVQ